MVDFEKETNATGKCYGVVYDPDTHKVQICYRNAPTAVTLIQDMTTEQKTACKTFAAAFLENDQDMTETEIKTALDTDMKAKIKKIKDGEAEDLANPPAPVE